MLTAYLDESGQEQDDWMFIAGYMGDDAAWRKFPELWAKAIGPQRDHLHMNSLRFSKEPVRKMLKRAAVVPKECGLIPLLAGVRLKDYADLLSQGEDAFIHAAYVMCCKAVTVIAMKSLPENERLEIVFERQDRYGWYADQAFEHSQKLLSIPNCSRQMGKPRGWLAGDLYRKRTLFCASPPIIWPMRPFNKLATRIPSKVAGLIQ